LLEIFGKARYHNEDFVLLDLEFFDKDIDQASEVDVLRWRHLEEFSHVEEHTGFLKFREVLALKC